MQKQRPRIRMMALPGALVVLVAAGFVALAVYDTAIGQPQNQSVEGDPNRRCLECHGREHIAELNPAERLMMVGTRLAPDQGVNDHGAGEGRGAGPDSTESGPVLTSDEPPTRPGLFVRPDALMGSVHAEVTCVECHTDARVLPHSPKLNLSTCATACHETEAQQFARSIHHTLSPEKQETLPSCASCHGGHAIEPVTNPDSHVFRLQAVELCGGCHRQHQGETPAGYDSKQHIDAYLESTHGSAITRSGLVVAATCADCHGMHEVLPSSDPDSLVHRDRVPDTCGQCHMGINKEYDQSIHGQLLARGDQRGPVCTDCHTAHRISAANGQDRFLTAVLQECGECHNNPELAGDRRTTFYETYRASYHGQVNQLGSAVAARCSDCHGAHNILPAEDPESTLHQGHLIQTCASCHEGANASFVKFDPHADYRDRDRYPVLYGVWMYFVIVMSGAFGFFGLHTILWFLRSLAERVRHGAHARPKPGAYSIKRFTTMNRINHVFVIITFFGLTATGLPLVFSGQHWSGPLIRLFGGAEAAGVLHRVFATMLLLNFAVHFYSLGRSAWSHRHSLFRDWLFGPNSMVPRWKDVTDCLGMFRWFFFGGRKPKFDRWTYWEKFDYWAEIFGSMIIGGSGLLLWFPEFASHILPGWMFNVAMVVHGYEALLAIGFIFTIHFFNAHLRLEKFPVDDVIFTGSLPEEEFIHERGEQYERAMKRNELDELKVPPPPEWQHRAAVVVGVMAQLVGLTLVVLIVMSGIRNLTG